MRARRLVLTAATVLAIGIAIVGVGSAWLLSSGGLRWSLAQLASWSNGHIKIEGSQGDVLGEFSARSVQIQLEGSTLMLSGLKSQMLQSDLIARSFHWRTLHIDEVLITPKPNAPAGAAPTSLRLPLAVDIDALTIGKVSVAGSTMAAVEQISARLSLQPAAHKITDFSAQWDAIAVQGKLELATGAPLQTSGSVTVKPRRASADLPAWQALLEANGPLARLPVTANLNAADQQLRATATVAPWAANPLPQLDARFAALDLQALIRAAPVTALAGTAVIALDPGQPMRLTLDARNEKPGPWNTGRLPLQSVSLQAVHAQQRWTVSDARIALPGKGTIDADGVWDEAGKSGAQIGEWSANLTLAGVDLQTLDQTLAAGLASGKLAGSGKIGVASGPFKWTGNIKSNLNVALLRAPPLTLESSSDISWPQQVAVESFKARSGAASIEGSALLKASAQPNTWQAQSDLRFKDVVPGLLLNASQQGGTAKFLQTTRLSGSATVKTTLVTGASAQLRGTQATLALTDSQLGGLPTAGDATVALETLPLTLPSTRTANATTPLWAQLKTDSTGKLQLAGNRLQWSGTTGAPTALLRVTLDAPELKQLGAVLPQLGLDAALAGNAQLNAQLAGQWPQLSINAQATGDALQWNTLAAGKLRATLQAGLATDAPLNLSLELESAATSADKTAPQIERARVSAIGTLSRSDVKISTALRRADQKLALESAAAVTVQGLPAPGKPMGALRLAANVAQLQAKDAEQVLLQAAPFAINWAREAGLDKIEATPGSAQVLGTQVRWTQARWQTMAGGQPARFAAEGDVPSLKLADLQRLINNDLLREWRGDLTLAGRFSIVRENAVTASVSLDRSGGDIVIGDDAGVNRLGLTEARLALDVKDGQWRVTHALQGSQLGRVDAQWSASASPQALFPPANAPARGNLNLQIENLAAWSGLAPPGWRLGGRVNGSATLAGTVGQPTAQGTLTLAGINVRNPLLGIDMREGAGSIVLSDTDVRLQDVRFAGGTGSISLNGNATLGQTQALRLSIKAEQFALLNRVDRRATVSGSTQIQIDAKRIAAEGAIRIDNGYVDISQLDAPSLSDDVVVLRNKQPPPSAASRNGKLQQDLNVSLNFGDNFRLRGRGIDTLLRGELRLTQANSALRAAGTLRAADGTYAAYNQRLEIERGDISFFATRDIGNPNLDILALRPNLDQRVGVAITGTALAPRVKLYSDPELPETEKLALLVTGKGFDGLSRDDTAVIQQAALALLAGESGGITGNLTRAIGLDTFAVGQRSAGDVRETVVTVGKQLSRRVFVGYERGLNTTTGTWQLIYNISNSFTVRVQSGADSALDIIRTWRWD